MEMIKIDMEEIRELKEIKTVYGILIKGVIR